MTYRSMRFALLAVSALGAGGVGVAGGLPQGGAVQQGVAGIQYSGDTLNINQQSDKAIISWKNFSVGKDNTVNFNQPSNDSATLNRVTGDVTSHIAGQINSNGSVFLINPNGIMITADGVIDTGNFVASTVDIDDNDFLNGDYTFTKNGKNGVVTNQGHISVDDGGFVALLGGAVKNDGTVRAHVGKVGFGGGEKIVMSFGNSDFLRVEVPTDKWDTLTDSQGNKVSATLDLGGTIESRGGFIDITVANASDILRQTISIDGIVAANTVSSIDGGISISGGALGITGNGRISADADYGNAGTITIDSDSIDSSGTVSAVAQNGIGGTIKVSLQHGANLNASTRFAVSGRTGGGKVSFIGGLGKSGTKILGSADFQADSTDGSGGYIDISNKDGLVGLLSGTLSATGKTQGGRIRLGGAFQGGAYDPKTSQLDKNTQHLFVSRWADNSGLVRTGKMSLGTGVSVDVSSTSGTGGTAIVWADHTTNTYAAIDATGSTGGGAVEISAKKTVESFGLKRVQAGNGVILLDPKNATTAWASALGQIKKFARAYDGMGLKEGDIFGRSVSLSGDGKKLAVGAPHDDSGGDKKGAVYLYTVAQSPWGQTVTQAVKISDSHPGVSLSNHARISLKDNDYFGYSVSLNIDGSKLAVGAYGDDDGGDSRGAAYLYTIVGSPWGQTVTQAVKLSDSHPKITLKDNDNFGYSVSLSGNGNTLAVGANGDDDGGDLRGAVYLYTVAGSSWGQSVTQVVKLSQFHSSISLDNGDSFGDSVSLSGDGSKLAVGASGDDDGEADSGAVYLYTIAGSTVTQAVKLSNTHAKVSLKNSDFFGTSVSLSGDGKKLAVGAYGDDGGGTDLGTVYLYMIAGSTVTQAVKPFRFHASVSDNGDNFGISVSLSADGSKLAVGASGDDDGPTQEKNQGAVYLYTVAGSSWGKTVTQATKLSNFYTRLSLSKDDRFGNSVSLSNDGSKLAVGARGDDDGGGVGNRGAVRLYTVGGSSWGQTVKQVVKLSDFHAEVSLSDGDNFGWGVSLSGDGTKLAVGAVGDDGAGDDQGAVYLYTLTESGKSWGQTVKQAVKLSHGASIKLANGNNDTISLDDYDSFGSSVSLSNDGSKLAVGASGDDDGGSDLSANRGAVYLYLIDKSGASGATWGSKVTQAVKLSHGASIKLANGNNDTISLDDNDWFGISVSLSDDGGKLAVGANWDDDGGTNRGAVYLYTVAGSPWGSAVTQAVKLSHGASIKLANGNNGIVSLDDGDEFGHSVSLSDNGSKLAVGVPDDGDGGNLRGAVYLYTVAGSPWGSAVTQAVKLSHGAALSSGTISLDNNDYFGSSVSLSGDGAGNDGARLVVGAYGDDDGVSASGAVYLYIIGKSSASGATWGSKVTQKKKLSNFDDSVSPFREHGFASSVSLSNDGSKLAVGATWDDTEGNSMNSDRGAVYLYTVTESSFGQTVTQVRKLSDADSDISLDLDNDDGFGFSVSLSGDGSKLAVGTPADDDGGWNKGAVYLFTVAGSSWGQKVTKTVKLSDSHEKVSLEHRDGFGFSVSLSSGGGELAVGAVGDDDGGGDNKANRGAVYLYTVAGSDWGDTVTQVKKLSNNNGSSGKFRVTLDNEDHFGWSVSLSSGGSKLAVGAIGDDDGGIDRGAVYLYTVTGSDWGDTITQVKKLSDNNGDSGKLFKVALNNKDHFGFGVSLSSDGSKLAVGAPGDGKFDRGAVYLYTLKKPWENWGETVTQAEKLSHAHDRIFLDPVDIFGWSVSLSGNGKKLAVGAFADDDGGGNDGAVYLINIPDVIDVAGLQNRLNGGGNLQIVASNDIVINHTITATQGTLTLIAGRSIAINADVTVAGGLVLKANNTSYVRGAYNDDGKSDVRYRDTGKAEITVATGTTISADSGDVFVKMLTGGSGAIASKKQTGNITVYKADGKRVSIIHSGTTDGNNDSEIIILSGGRITSKGASLASGAVGIELVADKFTNNSDSNALSVTSGRYLVWTKTHADNTMGGIARPFTQYDLTHDKSTAFYTNGVSDSQKSGFIYSSSKSDERNPNGDKDLSNTPNSGGGGGGGGAGGAAAVVLVGAGVAIAVGGIGGGAAAAGAAAGAGAAGAGVGAAGGAGAAGAGGAATVPTVPTAPTAPVGSIDTIFNSGLYAYLNGIDMWAISYPLQTPPVRTIFNTPVPQKVTYKAKYTTTYDMAFLARNIKAQQAVPLYELNEHLYETLKQIFVQQPTPTRKTARTHTALL